MQLLHTKFRALLSSMLQSIMSFFDFFKRKSTSPASSRQSSGVSGSLQYIPGSQTPMEDAPISLENGELVKRMYVQPDATAFDHSNIPIYTGNPFRDMAMGGEPSF